MGIDWEDAFGFDNFDPADYADAYDYRVGMAEMELWDDDDGYYYEEAPDRYEEYEPDPGKWADSVIGRLCKKYPDRYERHICDLDLWYPFYLVTDLLTGEEKLYDPEGVECQFPTDCGDGECPEFE